jgi:hypothetical protein
VRIEKGTRSALKAFAPSVLLKIGADDWAWGPTELERLQAGVAQVAGERWELYGPAVLREGFCVVRFDATFDRPPPAATKLLAALEVLPGLDDVVVAVPGEDRRLVELRSQAGCVTLRGFPRTAAATDGEVPLVWLQEALAVVEAHFGSPEAVAFGIFRSSKADDVSQVADVVREVAPASGGLGCAAVWFPPSGGGLVVGTTGGGGLQVAAIGAPATDDIFETAAWLRRLGLCLADAADLAYSRVSIEPTGLGAFSPFSRNQPGAPTSPNSSVTERRLDEWVPDAYWWQVIDKRMAERLPSGVSTSPVSDHLVEITFGEVVDWIPPTSWPGDADAPTSVDPLDALSKGRECLAPLLWGF